MNRLKELREIRGATVREVANATGITERTLMNAERDIRSTRTTTLDALVNYYGCSADYLLGIKEERK